MIIIIIQIRIVTWNNTSPCKLIVSTRNIWNHITVYKLLEQSIVIWS